MATQKQRRLGRGLSSLIQGPTSVPAGLVEEQSKTTQQTTDTGASTGSVGVSARAEQPAGAVRTIPVTSIQPNRFQPRRQFDEPSLARLAESITRSGLMQPIIVRPTGKDRFELVAGERRWRAAQLAGLRELPAVVRDLGDEDAAEWALVENMQREDLDPIERAHGLANLVAQFGLSHTQIGERLGLDRSTVANLIRLTELEEQVQHFVSSGRLQMGHARALLGMPPGTARLALAKRAASGGWSVRQVESAVRAQGDPGGQQQQNATPTQRQAVIADLERRLGEHLGTKVKITMRGNSTRGQLQIAFFNYPQFEGLMERMGLRDDLDA